MMDGWHQQASIKVHGCVPLTQIFTSSYLLLLKASLLCKYICVHIDVNLPLCVDLYLYETVILFPCHPCVQLSTAPSKTC